MAVAQKKPDGNASRASSDNSPEVIAAVDLGSNSFHMIVAELRHGQLTIIDRLRETVRLAAGLESDGTINKASERRALECLSRFGERLQDMRAASVRAAGTNTLRRARQDISFFARAEAALGQSIETISGIEEARLIYLGVTQSLPPADGLRLVMDIGGGSTELILGQAAQPRALESLALGCVSMTKTYFKKGKLSSKAFARARLAAKLELRPVKGFFRKADAVQAIGTSGTIRSTAAVARALGLLINEELTLSVVDELIGRVTEQGNVAELSLPGLSERRAQVWPGGLAILAELFTALRFERLQVSDGALREGLLYDLVGRLQHEDARERSVAALAARYNVDAEQAGRVADTSALLLGSLAASWKLDTQLDAQLLDWASRLHEIGLDISHNDFHRHGAYIAQHADLPGFPSLEQSILAFLIANQRGRIKDGQLDTLPRPWRIRALRLVILLRLAVLLNRSRSSAEQPPLRTTAHKRTLRLEFADGWLRANPLTMADIAREQSYLEDLDFELVAE